MLVASNLVLQMVCPGLDTFGHKYGQTCQRFLSRPKLDNATGLVDPKDVEI